MKLINKIALSLMIGSAAVVSEPSFAQNLNATYIKGSTIKETSNLSDAYLFDEVENLFLVSAEDYADALTGGVLAGEKNGSILYVKNGKIDSLGYKRIRQAQNVYAVGGEKAVPDNVVKNIKNFKGRISGSTRYETGVEVARTLGQNRNILIASGENFPDALAASALAIEKNMNIILTRKSELSESSRKYLQANKDKLVYFVGGEAAVSNAVKEEIFSVMGKDKKELNNFILFGKNRYETSKAVAEAFGPSKSAILADGGDYKDALLSSALSAQKKAPVFLISGPSQLNDLEKILADRKVDSLYALSTGENFKLSSLEEVASTLSGEEVAITDTVGKIVSKTSPKAEEIPSQSLSGWAGKDLEVKSGADASYRTVGRLPKGSKVSGKIINGYLHIEFDGSMRYVPVSGISKTEVKVENSYTTPSGENFVYKKAMNVVATAYNESGTYPTASGTYPKRGTIAVDPRVIPMGTLMYVEGYGFGRAEDTGGAIKGNKIDVYMNSNREAYQWGRKQVRIFIIK